MKEEVLVWILILCGILLWIFNSDLVANIILICFVIYLLNKWFFGFGAQKKFNRALKMAQDRLQKDEEFAKKFNSPLSKKSVKEIKDEITNLLEMNEMYIRLKEKYRHSFNKQRTIANDWLRYVDISLKMRDHDMAFSFLSDDKQLMKEHEERYTEQIQGEEIKKRFKKLLES